MEISIIQLVKYNININFLHFFFLQTMVTSSKIFVESDSVWYCNALVGEKKLSTFLSCLSKAAGFSQIYTNYSIRATGSSILLTSMVGPSQDIAVTRHKSVQKCMSKRQWRENYNNDGRLIYRKHSTYNGRFTKLKKSCY